MTNIFGTRHQDSPKDAPVAQTALGDLRGPAPLWWPVMTPTNGKHRRPSRFDDRRANQ